MAGGWGCQFLTKFNGQDDWCRRLKHKCQPGCNGCILQATSSNVIFTTLNFENIEEDRKPKKRSDNPLGDR